MGEDKILRAILYLDDDTEVEMGNLKETKLVNDLFKNKPTKSHFSTATDASLEFTVQMDTDNEFFRSMVEEHRKYQAMTREERTLYHTGDKYDMIVCPSERIKELLTKEFGDLNYIVNGLVIDVLLIDSRIKF